MSSKKKAAAAAAAAAAAGGGDGAASYDPATLLCKLQKIIFLVKNCFISILFSCSSLRDAVRRPGRTGSPAGGLPRAGDILRRRIASLNHHHLDLQRRPERRFLVLRKRRRRRRLQQRPGRLVCHGVPAGGAGLPVSPAGRRQGPRRLRRPGLSGRPAKLRDAHAGVKGLVWRRRRKGQGQEEGRSSPHPRHGPVGACHSGGILLLQRARLPPPPVGHGDHKVHLVVDRAEGAGDDQPRAQEDNLP